MPQHSYKQLEEAYQRGVNKEHKCCILIQENKTWHKVLKILY